MSDALYLNMFSTLQNTSYERKRKKRRWLMEKTVKALCYAGVIVGTAAYSPKPLESMGLAALVCLVAECFR